MATQFIDGFDHYAIGNILSKWSAIGGGGAQGMVAGRFGGHALQLQKVLPVPVTNLVAGFAFQLASNITSHCNLISFYSGGTEQISVCLNTDGTLTFQRGGTNLAATNASGFTHLTVGQWSYIEVQVAVNSSVSANT